MTSVLIYLAIVALGEGAPAPGDHEYTAYWLYNARTDSGKAHGPKGLLLSRWTFAQLEKRYKERELGSYLIGRVDDSPLLEADALRIDTAGKDSIWNAERHPIRAIGMVIHANDAEGTLSIDGVPYRVEVARIEEVIHLLENPEGAIPLPAPHPPLAGVEQTARALALLLRDQLERRR